MQIRNLYKLGLFVISALILSTGTQASEEHLQSFFAEVKTLQADFTQVVVDETGMTLESASGRFSLARPGRFRWDYLDVSGSGEIGQQIVADGSSIYLFDPDLEQVTRRSMQDALAQVPSMVLVQDGGDVQRFFTVTDIGVTDGLSWVALKPRDENAAYQQLMLGFGSVSLQSILLLDGLGNETRLELSAVNRNPELADDHFEFNVPEGADVLDQ